MVDYAAISDSTMLIWKQTLNLFFIFIFLSFFLLIFNDSYILIKRNNLALPSFRIRGTGWSPSNVLSITGSVNSYVKHTKHLINANKPGQQSRKWFGNSWCKNVKQTPCNQCQRLTAVYQSSFTDFSKTDPRAIVSGTVILKLPKHGPTKLLLWPSPIRTIKQRETQLAWEHTENAIKVSSFTCTQNHLLCNLERQH